MGFLVSGRPFGLEKKKHILLGPQIHKTVKSIAIGSRTQNPSK
jgi:hypothetical protein